MLQASYDYIDSNQKLSDFCRQFGDAGYCTIDTEFIREKTYYPILSLIQIANEDRQACIDPLAIDNFDPLIELLKCPSLLKVFHSCSQDLEILYQKFGQVPAPVFDTQLAAATLGYAHQISYADLVQQITGTQLEKKHTRADWSKRPLSEDELDYAMDDVRYLMPVYRQLCKQLEASKRKNWIEKDFELLSDAANYEVDMALLWKRLKGVQKLKGVKLQIASDLARWREAIAQDSDRPRRWIIKDEVICEIARRIPESLEQLEEIRDLSEKLITRHGEALIKIVAQAQKVDSEQWPKPTKSKLLSIQQLALGDCLMALCRVIADQNDIALTTLTTRKDIDQLILKQNSSRLTQGWRLEMAGEQLLNFLHGESHLSVQQQGLKLSS